MMKAVKNIPFGDKQVAQSETLLPSLSGHLYSIMCARFSHTNKNILFTSSFDCTARRWNLQTFEQEDVFFFLPDPLENIVLSSDDRWVAGVTSESSLYIFDHETRRTTRILEDTVPMAVFSFSPHPGDHRLAVVCFDLTIRVFNCDTDEETQRINFEEMHAGTLGGTAMVWHPMGIILGFTDGAISIFNPDTGELIKDHEESHISVMSIDYRSDGALASCGEDGFIRLWNLDTGEELASVDIGEAMIKISAADKKIVSASEWWLEVWDPSSGETKKIDHGTSTSSVAITNDFIARGIGGQDGKSLQIWDLDGNPIKIIEGRSENVNSAAIFPDGSKVITGSVDKCLHLLEPTNGTEIAVLKGHNEAVASVSVNKDGTIASSSFDDTIRLWRGDTGDQIREIRATIVSALSFTPDGTQVIAGASGEMLVKVFDLTGSLVHNLSGLEEFINSVCPAKGKYSQFFYTGSDDGSIMRWDLSTGAGSKYKHYEGAPVLALATSDDGKLLGAGLQDGKALIFDVEKNKSWETLAPEPVGYIAISPDTKLVAFGSKSNMFLWDWQSENRPTNVSNYKEPIKGIFWLSNDVILGVSAAREVLLTSIVEKDKISEVFETETIEEAPIEITSTLQLPESPKAVIGTLSDLSETQLEEKSPVSSVDETTTIETEPTHPKVSTKPPPASVQWHEGAPAFTTAPQSPELVTEDRIVESGSFSLVISKSIGEIASKVDSLDRVSKFAVKADLDDLIKRVERLEQLLPDTDLLLALIQITTLLSSPAGKQFSGSNEEYGQVVSNGLSQFKTKVEALDRVSKFAVKADLDDLVKRVERLEQLLPGTDLISKILEITESMKSSLA